MALHRLDGGYARERLFNFYGDGRDGVLDINAPVADLVRAMFHTRVTIRNGGILPCGGFPVFATEAIVVEAGGIIHRDGNNAAGAAAGAGFSNNYLGASGAGGAGAVAGGAAGTAATQAQGGNGGAGGAGTAGAGGAGGVSVAPTANQGSFPALLLGLMLGSYVTGQGALAILRGGSGAGGGSGDGGAVSGGGGGAGGGVLLLVAPQIVLVGATSVIRARGGNGAAGAGAGAGGGGGGGGGLVILLCDNGVQGDDLSGLSVAGGTPGAGGGGAGLVGVAGAVGLILRPSIYVAARTE